MGGKVGCGPSYVFTKIAMHARSHSATQSLSHSANPLLSHSANQPLRLSRYGRNNLLFCGPKVAALVPAE